MSLMYKSKSSNDILKRNPTNNGLTLNYDNNKNNINFGKTFFSFKCLIIIYLNGILVVKIFL